MALAPAATLRIPSCTIDWARTVAVVVPSPATSFVLVAASFKSCAPILANGSSSSISLATVTPSWVTVGAPYFLSSATLRPFGPSVVLTAFARVSTPSFKEWRAAVLNSRILAMLRNLHYLSDIRCPKEVTQKSCHSALASEESRQLRMDAAYGRDSSFLSMTRRRCRLAESFVSPRRSPGCPSQRGSADPRHRA